MTTKKETPQGGASSLPVEHMPPLNVTTEGIPALEHVHEAGPSPVPGRRRASSACRAHRNSRVSGPWG